MKALVIRLSSIGDIVLATPVLRCLHQQQGAEVHVLTKPAFALLLQGNPHVAKVHTWQGSHRHTLSLLVQERYDFVADLQRNRRSRRLARALHTRHATFRKEDLRRLLCVALKRDCCTGLNVAQRYFGAVRTLGVRDDGGGLECFFPNEKPPMENYVAVVCGAQHATKQIPLDKLLLLCARSIRPVALIGGAAEAERLKGTSLPPNTTNFCGATTLAQSANLIRHAAKVVTPDTGMMHIAAAYQRDAIVVWGCTTPQMGFSPFRAPCRNMEVTLPCRPCSRFGLSRCPKRHYNCMRLQDWDAIVALMNASDPL